MNTSHAPHTCTTPASSSRSDVPRTAQADDPGVSPLQTLPAVLPPPPARLWQQPERPYDGHLRVLHVATEVYPYVKTGGLGDILAALPVAQQGQGVDARVLLPGFPAILDGLDDLALVADLGSMMGAARVRVLWGRLRSTGVPAYVVDAPWYFRREGSPYLGPDNRDWSDNARRFALLGKVAAHLAWGDIDPVWQADVMHAHDWHAGLAPVYLRQNPVRRVRSVFSIHNLAYQGLFPLEAGAGLELEPWMLRAPDGLEYYGQGSFMKGGLVFADWVSTVSPRYAYEITTPEFGVGLDGVLLSRRDRLTGILNGIDQEVWNPATDTRISANYSVHDLGPKWINKERVQQILGLQVDPGRMLAVIVSRLTDQKGADLLLGVLPRMRELGIQLALVGSGDPALQESFRRAAEENPGSVAAVIGYDEPLSHQLIAGGDIILVPSRFEPCGLTQMYGLRYGTLPLVRRVGGLADTVHEYHDGQPSNGFVFQNADVHDFALALSRAADVWQDRGAWEWRMRTAMAADHGWGPAAHEYLEMYRRVLGDRY